MKDRYILVICALVAVSGMLLCTPVNDVAGGSSSTDNGKVVGTIYDEDGVPSSNTQVVLRSSFFTPNQDTATPPVDTTDAAGEYYFDSLKAGIYTIEAVELTNRTRALVNAVLVDSLTTHASDAALSKPGALEVAVQTCSTDSCYVYVPGTSLYGIVRDGIAFIDSVPAGVLPAVYYADKSDPSSVHTVQTTLNVQAGVTLTVSDYPADNGRVAGTIYSEDGTPSSNTKVVLRSSSFRPNQDTAKPAFDTTDTAGNYYFHSLKAGMYTIEAVELTNRSRALVNAVMVDSATTYAADAALSQPGALQVEVQACSTDSCYVYVPGTSLFGIVRNGIAFIDSVPAGVLPAVYYADKSDPSSVRSIQTAINISAGVTHVVTDYSAWSHSARIYLNTTAVGAEVPENVYDFPVLVRLTSEHIDFTAAQSDGRDLRFRKADNTPLAFEIERWDVAAGQAEVWVLVDTVYGNDSTHYFIMYWGNETVSSTANSAAVFDTARGYEGVWHLGGDGGVAVLDATGNNYDGTPSIGAGVASVEGAIGGARAFDGSSGYISMDGTAESKLNFPQNGTYSMSLWVYADTIDTTWRAIAGKGHEQYYMQLKCLGNGRATWEFVEFQDNLGWEFTEDSVPPAPGAGEWLYLVGVRDGRNQRFYINGEVVIDTISLKEGEYPRNSSDNFTIGRFGHEVIIPNEQGWSFFDGMIDEVRVERRVPSASRIRLGYMNQKAADALVVIKK